MQPEAITGLWPGGEARDHMDNVLHLLIAEESLNDAEMLLSMLRNGGHAVRAVRVEDEEELRDALDQNAFDLFLCSLNLPLLPLSQAQLLVQQAAKDIPVIAVSEQDDPELRRQAIADGAVDMVSKQDLFHLQHVVSRELGGVHDRRRLRRVEAALRESERRCYALLQSSRDPIAYVHEGMHIYANAAYLEKFGFSDFAEIEGLPLLDLVQGENRTRLKEFLRDFQKGKTDLEELELVVCGDSHPIPVTMSFCKASIEGEDCTQILLRDRGTSQELARQLDDLSKRDLLTGLFNRNHFMEQLDKAVIKSKGARGTVSHALLYIQLDNLDALQQSVGITAVDGAIAQLAQILAAEVGADGLGARFADETFAVLLPDTGVHEAIALAEAIRQRVEEHVAEVEGRTITTTCSVGVCMLGEASESATDVVNHARQAAEVARGNGGNRVHLHDAAAGNGSSTALRRQLEAALADNDFFLVFQPVASLKGATAERYEVRLRWRTEDGEVLPPQEFVPQAEKAGLMAALDRWTTQAAIRLLVQRLADGHDTLLFIKLSGASLTDHKRFIAFLGEQLDTHGLDGRRLVFQLNEPEALTQLNHAKEIFRGLKTLQCGMALDQFGSGLNPFQLVKHLPAEYLKLDSTLTRGLAHNEELQQTVKQIIATAHSMNKRVIAGYLEDVSSLAMLWQYDADFVQGYFLQEPEPEMSYDFSGMVI